MPAIFAVSGVLSWLLFLVGAWLLLEDDRWTRPAPKEILFGLKKPVASPRTKRGVQLTRTALGWMILNVALFAAAYWPEF